MRRTRPEILGRLQADLSWARLTRPETTARIIRALRRVERQGE